MTTQEAYEIIRAHFTKPGAELAQIDGISDDSPYGGTCFYRENLDPKSERRCAFGVLIPDEIYHPSMEGTGALGLLRQWPILRERLGILYTPDFSERNDSSLESFVARAQSTHDCAINVELFIKDLDELAVELGLKVV